MVRGLRPLATVFTVLLLELPARHSLCVGSFDDIDRLGALLQRPHHLLQMTLLVLQIGADDVFAGRAHRHAIGRLVVGAKGQALPHG